MTWAVIVFALSREAWGVLFWAAFIVGVVRGILDEIERG
jgi:hypothetical protein